MSPTKSKDPSPSRKNVKPKTPAVEAKPRSPSSKRKSSNAAADDEQEGTAAGGPVESASAGKAAKGTDAKVKTPATETIENVDDVTVKAPAEERTATDGAAAKKGLASEVISPGSDAKVESPVADAGATATPATVKSPAAGKGATGGEPSGQTPAESDVSPAVAPPVAAAGAEAPAISTAEPAEKRLDFPKGAMIAYRKSGGLKFSSREIVVYPDGRVTYDGGDTAKTALTRAARRMNDAQVMRLRRTLEQVNFFGMNPPPSQQDPDSFVIEIAARLGGKNNQIEVSAGNMPGALNPLIEQLTKLLPSDE